MNGKISALRDYGVFVTLEEGGYALLHKSQISKLPKPFNISDIFKLGDYIRALVVAADVK